MDEKLPPHLQRKLEQYVVHSAIEQNMSLMTNLSERCFTECVHKFHSKLLDKDESACIEHCVTRYVAMTERVGKRYQQHQSQVVAKAENNNKAPLESSSVEQQQQQQK